MPELFPYQQTGAKWLASMHHALLADDMGLGKSAQVIHAADLIGAKRLVIVCPAAARINWLREFERFSSVKRKIVVVETAKTPVTHGDTVIISYDLAMRRTDLGEFDLAVADESHFLKSLEAKRTAAILGSAGIIHKSKRFWAISGTPAPNHVGELWPLLYTFGITPLTYWKFIEHYCATYEGLHGTVVAGTRMDKIPEIKTLLGKIMLRRKKEEVMKELPEIFFQDVVVEPGPVNLDTEISFIKYVFPKDNKDLLDKRLAHELQLVESAAKTVGFSRDGMKVLEGLANSVATLRRYTGLQKLQSAADIIEQELENNAYDKIVLFAVHQSVIEGLRQRLKKFGAVTLYGQTNLETRQKNIDAFQNKPHCRVFIGNIKAAGTAITLTAASQVAFIEQEWTPADMAQAAMRCHRIGQTRPVFVRFFSLSNSIDEKITAALKRKTRELTEIFDVN